MLVVSEESRSEPNERDMATRIASPRAASQAPNDRSMKMRNGLFRDVRQCITAVRAVRVNRMLSVASRTIRR